MPNTRRSLTEGMFVAAVEGRSMEPRIPDGASCLFRAPVRGDLVGKVVLVAHRRFHDPETNARCAVKRFGGTVRRHDRVFVRLLSENPAFDPIEIEYGEPSDLTIVAECVEALGTPA